MKKIIAIIIIVVGLAALGGSFYVKRQVAQGRQQISEGQSKVDTGQGLLKSNPFTNEAGKILSAPAQSKIDAGTREADSWAQYAQWLKWGGIALIVIGFLILLNRRK